MQRNHHQQRQQQKDELPTQQYSSSSSIASTTMQLHNQQQTSAAMSAYLQKYHGHAVKQRQHQIKDQQMGLPAKGPHTLPISHQCM